MSKNFLPTVQGLTILDKTILAYIIGRGVKPTTGRTLCRKINILNSTDEADAATSMLLKAGVLRTYGADGHVMTKDFRADEAALAEMEKFSPTVSTAVKANKTEKEKVKVVKAKVTQIEKKPDPIVETLTESAIANPKRDILLQQISNVAKKLNQPLLPGVDNLDLKKEALAGLADIFSDEDAELQSLLLEIGKDLDMIASAA
jgi:hypothetical protein